MTEDRERYIGQGEAMNDDEMAKARLGRAYWISVPLAYLTAVGAVTAQWGYFEMQFEGLLVILKRHPQASQLDDKGPSFQQRAKLLRRMARVAFAATPTLAEKISAFSVRAYDLCRKRNVLIHGFWFDMTPFDPTRGVTIMTEPDGTGDFYSVALSEIEALAVQINTLNMEGPSLLFPPFTEDRPHLTPDELAALQQFHADFPPPPAMVPIPRDPGRKGTVQRPEPFRA